ncbi:unnamed protein product, partial [Coccothraustes coccothraustes]
MTSLRKTDVKHHVPPPALSSPPPPPPPGPERLPGGRRARLPLRRRAGAEPLPLGRSGPGEEAGVGACGAALCWSPGLPCGRGTGISPDVRRCFKPSARRHPLSADAAGSVPSNCVSCQFLVSLPCSSRDFSPFFREVPRMIRDLWRSASPTSLPRQGHLERVTQERVQEDSMQNLRHINRQMRLLDLRLQLLRERLCSARLNRCLFSCCCLPQPYFRRRCIAARNERTKRLGMMLNSSSGQNLALIDVKGFDPRDITVTVKDGKVTVSAERKVECNTGCSKTSNYKKFVKEFCLPPGVCDKEVTYSVESQVPPAATQALPLSLPLL